MNATKRASERRLRVVEPLKVTDADDQRERAERIDALLAELHAAVLEVQDHAELNDEVERAARVVRECFAELHEETAHMRRASLAAEGAS